jgi:hypothetical protein
MSVANQLMTAITKATMLHSPSQKRCGIASSSRKKTVSRERWRSSVTTRRIGCVGPPLSTV